MRQLSAPLDSICQPLPARAPVPRRPAGATDALIANAGALIAETGATLLLIERTVRASGVSIRIDTVAADGSRTRGIARSGDPAMRAVCHSANAVLRQLAGILPDDGEGAGLGLMTDGTGALFSPDRPSVLGEDWLGAMLSGATPAADLVPFDPAGRWARLAALRHGGRAH